jgi:hypothetical protein
LPNLGNAPRYLKIKRKIMNKYIKCLAISVSLSALVLNSAVALQEQTPNVCLAPAGDPEEGTLAFEVRDANNILCSELRKADAIEHPINPVLWPTLYGADPYRQPKLHDDVRFRYDSALVSGIEADIFQPCALDSCPERPEGLETFEPPYPVVIAMHGFGSDKDQLWWATQPLAERGYFVVAIQGTDSTVPGIVLDWLHNDAQAQYPGQLDLSRVGTMGHSLGAENSTRVQGDERVSAIIAWDPCSGAPCENSNGSRLYDLGQAAQTPTLFIAADYSGFPGYAEPRFSVPSELRLEGFSTLRNNGVDSMLIIPRATTHLDWAGNFTMGTRYGETTSNHYNLAWFDRYLRGKLVLDSSDNIVTTGGRNEAQERTYRQDIAQQAFDRLIATKIDDTLDKHNISQGFFDPVLAASSENPQYGGNVPYATEGIVIADLLSFYYRSVCFVSLPNYNGESGDIVARGDSTNEGNMRQTGCPVTVTAIDLDSDGDGVNDEIDQCINNEPDTLVDASGCELSTDPTLSPRDTQSGAGSLGLLMFISLIGTALGRRRQS